MGMFDKITGIWSQDMAIDLGTANTLVVLKEMILYEPALYFLKFQSLHYIHCLGCY